MTFFTVVTKVNFTQSYAAPELSDAPWLTWHRRAHVRAFAEGLGAEVQLDDGYEPGDCTAVMRKRGP